MFTIHVAVEIVLGSGPMSSFLPSLHPPARLLQGDLSSGSTRHVVGVSGVAKAGRSRTHIPTNLC